MTNNNLSVTLLYGGRSPEHEVSLSSAAGVLRALNDNTGHTLTAIGISREGHWFIQDLEAQLHHCREGLPLSIDTTAERRVVVIPGAGLARRNGSALATDCVFPVLHGSYGEDGTLQGLLEMAFIPYVGSGVVGSSVGMDKLRSKQLWQQNDLAVVPYLTTTRDEPAGGLHRRIQTELGYPVFVKPNAAGSSIGISRVAREEELEPALQRAFHVDSCVLVEAALPVREIETAVLGNETPRAFPPGEVIPTHEFYDYDAKYTDPDGAQLVAPADLPAQTAEQIMEISCRAFTAVAAAGLARVDSFIHRETGEVFLNEINTIPGFTPISMYPRMVQSGGVPYGELLQTLITLAMARRDEQSRIDYLAR